MAVNPSGSAGSSSISYVSTVAPSLLPQNARLVGAAPAYAAPAAPQPVHSYGRHMLIWGHDELATLWVATV